jgi:L-alanine-DL-glutamate epimerase-like enolase superfamily enzyme
LKIIGLEVFRVQVPLNESYMEVGPIHPEQEPVLKTSADFALARVSTDEGLVGVGAQVWGTSSEWCRLTERTMKPFLVNEIVEPWNVGRFAMYFNCIGPFEALNPAPYSIEMALWDLLGKKAGLPIYRMLGALQDKVKAYCTSQEVYPQWSPEEYVEFGRKIRRAGFRAMKPHMGWRKIPDTKYILEVVSALREGLGDEMGIIVDVNQAFVPRPAFTLPEAVKLARALEKFDVLWLEEPMLHLRSPEVGAELCRQVDLPIGGGSHISGWQNFKTVMQSGSLDVITPEIQFSGGITEMRKIHMLCEVYGKQCAPHGLSNGITHAATMQVAGCTTVQWVEYKYQPPNLTDEVRDGVLKTVSHIDREGYSHVPTGPGLGIELDEDKLAKYRLA